MDKSFFSNSFPF